MTTLPDDAGSSGALESDLPFVLASFVAPLCCAWSTWTGQSAASKLAHAHFRNLVVPWPVQSLLLEGSTTCAAAPETDTHRSVALEASISLSIHQEETMSNLRGLHGPVGISRATESLSLATRRNGRLTPLRRPTSSARLTRLN